MNRELKPAGYCVMLVGMTLFFILFYLHIGLSSGFDVYPLSGRPGTTGVDIVSDGDYPGSLGQIKEFHTSFVAPGSGVASARQKPNHIFASDKGTKESISMTGPSEGLQGMVALNNKRQRDIIFDGSLASSLPNMNYMDIEVKGITVIAVNMVKGGNAVATSDIVLKPVQYIGGFTGAEVDDKLK